MLFAVFVVLEDDDGKNNDGISFSSSTGPAWAGSERDYTYDEVRLRSCGGRRDYSFLSWPLNCLIVGVSPASEPSLQHHEGEEPGHGGWREEEVCDEASSGGPSGNQENLVRQLHRHMQTVRLSHTDPSCGFVFMVETDLFNLVHHRLHRQPKHLLAFLLAELGTRYVLCVYWWELMNSICLNSWGSWTQILFFDVLLSFCSGSIDGNNQLVIKGRFQQKQIENVLRRYISKWLLLFL